MKRFNPRRRLHDTAIDVFAVEPCVNFRKHTIEPGRRVCTTAITINNNARRPSISLNYMYVRESSVKVTIVTSFRTVDYLAPNYNERKAKNDLGQKQRVRQTSNQSRSRYPCNFKFLPVTHQFPSNEFSNHSASDRRVFHTKCRKWYRGSLDGLFRPTQLHQSCHRSRCPVAHSMC